LQHDDPLGFTCTQEHAVLAYCVDKCHHLTDSMVTEPLAI